MSAVSATPVCTREGCDASTTGVCSLGNDPIESCPNFDEAVPFEEEDAETGDIDDGSEAGRSEASEKREIRPSGSMSRERLNRFLQAEWPRHVVIAGEPDAGKTTVIAALFALFCRGKVAGFSFAGSQTIEALAMRNHLAMVGKPSSTSDADMIPKTPRTSRNDPIAYLHFAVRRPGEGVRHLIVSDRSGEIYDATRTDTSIVAELEEFADADLVVFAVDGSKLASRQHRAYGREFRGIIRALHDNGALDRRPAVEIVVTKLDVVEASEDSERQLQEITQFETDIASELLTRGLTVGCHRLSALPACKPDIADTGMEALFSRWMSPATPNVYNEVRIERPVRLIDKLEARGW